MSDEPCVIVSKHNIRIALDNFEPIYEKHTKIVKEVYDELNSQFVRVWWNWLWLKPISKYEELLANKGCGASIYIMYLRAGLIDLTTYIVMGKEPYYSLKSMVETECGSTFILTLEQAWFVDRYLNVGDSNDD